MRSDKTRVKRARGLRATQTEAEGLLWSLLRARQIGGLKFRRQHLIGAFFADFACVSRRIVVELDGDYHDHVQADDLSRQRYLESQGWEVIRFTNDDAMKNPESVVRAIAEHLGVEYTFDARRSKGSGMMSENANKRLSPE